MGEMIIDENDLMEQFSFGDDVGYAFLINNAEDEEQVLVLSKLSEIYKTIVDSENEDIEDALNAYEEARNAILKEEIGLNMAIIIEISCLTNF